MFFCNHMEGMVLAWKLMSLLKKEDILDGNQIVEQKKKCIFLCIPIEKAIWQKVEAFAHTSLSKDKTDRQQPVAVQIIQYKTMAIKL